MAYNLKDVIVNTESRFTPGHRMCAGCGAPPVARMVLRAVNPEDHVVVANATGCMEVSTCIYPYTAWTDSYIHTAFENAAATCSGAEAAYKSMKRQGKLPENKTTKFITFGGDGGTYDIGIQSLSGAMERGHDMTYVCYDNGAYMNTGIQRSSATPKSNIYRRSNIFKCYGTMPKRLGISNRRFNDYKQISCRYMLLAFIRSCRW